MEPKKMLCIFGTIYALIALIFIVFWGKAVDFDSQISSALINYSNPVLDIIFLGITYLGSIVFWFLIVAVLWLKKDKKASALLFIGLIVDTIIIILLKYSFSRPRPNLGSITEITPSFPSGHTSRAFLGAMLIKYYNPLLIIIAVLVGISRVYLGVHYFSDILFGAMTGIFIALLIRTIPQKKIDNLLKKISKRF